MPTSPSLIRRLAAALARLADTSPSGGFHLTTPAASPRKRKLKPSLPKLIEKYYADLGDLDTRT